MKLSLIYMDAGRELFAGFGMLEPILVWKPADALWLEIAPHVRCEGWAQRVSPSEALRCYPGSVGAALPPGFERDRVFSFEKTIRLRPDLFDDYDGPYMRRSQDELSRYEARVKPIALRGDDAD